MTQLAHLLDPNRRNLDDFHYVFLARPSIDQIEYERDKKEIEDFIHSLNKDATLLCVTIEEILSPQSPEKVKLLMEKCPDPSDLALLKEILYKVALVEIGFTEDYSKIYISDTNNDLATEIFNFVCHGKGSTIPWILSPIQLYRSKNVGIVRPLRDVSNVEINYHLERLIKQYPNIPTDILQRTSKENDVKSSINSLTKGNKHTTMVL